MASIHWNIFTMRFILLKYELFEGIYYHLFTGEPAKGRKFVDPPGRVAAEIFCDWRFFQRKLASPHCFINSKTGTKLLPKSVKEYSTFGGIS